MKLSVSVTEQDVAVVDGYARSAGLPSRSAAIQHAIRLLSMVDLESDYAQAWQDWEASGEHQVWESVAGDGLADAAR